MLVNIAIINRRDEGDEYLSNISGDRIEKTRNGYKVVAHREGKILINNSDFNKVYKIFIERLNKKIPSLKLPERTTKKEALKILMDLNGSYFSAKSERTMKTYKKRVNGKPKIAGYAISYRKKMSRKRFDDFNKAYEEFFKEIKK